MSNFFAGLSGVQFPQVVMNQGPVPGTGGLPAPLHDTADARINYNSTLLGDIDAYAYGEPGYLSSQTSYVNHPHMIQKIVPELNLPMPIMDTQRTFAVSHVVDDSDIAFVMRLDRGSTVCSALKSKALARKNLGTAIDPFVNLCTLNYLLAGVQLCIAENVHVPSQWTSLLYDLDQIKFNKDSLKGTDIDLSALFHIVHRLITPFGIVRGSEKQGGQDETGLGAATWPVPFITSMSIDGKERDVAHIWYDQDVSAGADVVLRMKPMPLQPYTLNHYYKHVVKQDFRDGMKDSLKTNNTTHVWQLVPDIFTLEIDPSDAVVPNLPPHLKTAYPANYAWQEYGYWHIGRTQIMFKKPTSDMQKYYNNDMAYNMRFTHLEMTFEPVWMQAYKKKQLNVDKKVVFPHGPPMGAAAGSKRAKWDPKLFLEMMPRRGGDSMDIDEEAAPSRAGGSGLDLSSLMAPPRNGGGGGGLDLGSLSGATRSSGGLDLSSLSGGSRNSGGLDLSSLSGAPRTSGGLDLSSLSGPPRSSGLDLRAPPSSGSVNLRAPPSSGSVALRAPPSRGQAPPPLAASSAPELPPSRGLDLRLAPAPGLSDEMDAFRPSESLDDVYGAAAKQDQAKAQKKPAKSKKQGAPDA